jgi:hypothetical protein
MHDITRQIKITNKGIDDLQGVVFSSLSEPTKEFVRYLRKKHNAGQSKLYKEVLSNNLEPTRYSLQLQASLYTAKLSDDEARVFAEETEWRKATDDAVFDWIKEIFKNVR